MLPKLSKSRTFDKIHRFGVYSCMALTGYGLVLAGYNIYCYFAITKPEMIRRREQLKLELLREGDLKE